MAASLPDDANCLPSTPHERQEPAKEDEEAPPVPRQVTLLRDPEVGFGFVAGSEKPVVVRFVKEGGPSEGKLQSEDQILEINGEDVSKAPRDRVIELVKSCKQCLKMTVCQPHRSTNKQTMRKSSLLTAAKKAKLKSNPSRVRFADGVTVNGNSASNYSSFDSCVPFMPNVLKVFLENGQTKTFKYDSNTCVQDVLNSLVEKLSIRNPLYFSLCLEHMKARRRNKLTLLDPKDSLSKVASRPGSHNLRCLFRVVFVPKDISELLMTDPVSFEYFYAQSCNDIVQERFAPELKYEIALRLSALHLLQHALTTGMVTNANSKVNVKAIEKEFTLKPFVPYTLVETMKSKELHKLLNHYLKQNQVQLCPPAQKTLTALEAKVHYLKLIAELPSYGAKIFPMNIRESILESAILVSRKLGLSHVTALRNSMPVTLARIEDIVSIRITSHEDLCTVAVEIHLKDASGGLPFLTFALEEKDADELALTLQGYHRLILSESTPPSQSQQPYKELPVLRETLMQPNERTELGDFVRKMEGSSFTSPSTVEENEVTANSNGKWLANSDCKGHNNVTHGYDVNSIGTDSHHSLDEPSPPRGTFRVVSTLDRHPLAAARRQKIVADAASSANEDSPLEDDEDDTGSRNSQCDSLQASEEIDLPSIVSMEILESAIVAEKKVKSEDVVQRLAEMRKIVADAQNYLHESSSEFNGYSDAVPTSKAPLSQISDQNNKLKPREREREGQVSDDCESIRSDSSSNSASLRATDSLLLIRHTPHGHLNNYHNGGSSLGTSTLEQKPCKPSLVSHPTLSQLDAAGVSAKQSSLRNDSKTNGHCDTLSNENHASFVHQPQIKQPHLQLYINGSGNEIAAPSSSPTNKNTYEVTFTNSVVEGGGFNHQADSSDLTNESRQHHLYDHMFLNSLPNLSDAENELIESLKRFGDEEVYYCNVPMNMVNCLTYDQEIIDLTALPPPGEEEEGQHENIVPEAKVVQEDDLEDQPTYLNLASLRLTDCMTNEPNSNTHEEENEYTNILMPMVTNNSTAKVQSNYGNHSVPLVTSQRHSREMLSDDSGNLANIEDLIASLSVPPPPLNSVFTHEIEPTTCASQDVTDDLESLIVPPPPDDAFPLQQEDVIAKFWKLTDDVKKIYAPSNGEPVQASKTSTCIATSATQISPKAGSREVHSSSSGDSGYESILVLNTAPCPSSSNCKPELTSRTATCSVPSIQRTPHQLNRSHVSSDCKTESPSNVNDSCPGHSFSHVNQSLRIESQVTHLLPVVQSNAPLAYQEQITQLAHQSSSSSFPKELQHQSEQQSSSCPSNAAAGKKVPPRPPVRSKPPIPPISPSIQERRKQLALAKAQTKAKAGVIPVVKESSLEGSDHSEPLFITSQAVDQAIHPSGPISQYSNLLSNCEGEQVTLVHHQMDGSSSESPLQGFHPNPYPNSFIRKQHNVTDIFAQVQKNIRVLVSRVEDLHETRLRCDPCDSTPCDESKLNQSKNLLIMESRVFVTASKLFVKLATEGSTQVLNHLLECYSLLDRMFKIAEVIVINTESQAQVTCLVDRLKEVASNFSRTIETVVSLIKFSTDGSPSMECLASQNRKTASLSSLMNHATCLATSLSALMRTLTAFSSY